MTTKSAGTEESLRRYEQIVSATPDPISLIDRNYVYLFTNAAYRATLGTQGEDIVGRSVADVWGTEVFESTIKEYLDRCLSGETAHYSGRFPFGQRGSRFMSVTYYPYFDALGELAGAVVSSRDLTDLQDYAQALQASEEQYHGLFELSGDALLVFDSSGIVRDANRAACDLFGLEKHRLVANTVFTLFAQGQHHEVTRAVEQHAGPAPFSAESACVNNTGTVFPVEVRFARVTFQRQQATLAAVRDTTQRKRLEERLAYSARHDFLTDLPNLSYFRELLQATLLRAKRRDDWMGLLFVDLDRFKPVNDTYGHAAGDQVLSTVASRLSTALREIDVAARVGGDEFAVILESLTGVSDAAVVAEKISKLVQRPIRIDGQQIAVGASIGIAIYPIDGPDAQTLLRRADAAMYEAKRVGSRFSGPPGSGR